jgi:hypothetical protein
METALFKAKLESDNGWITGTVIVSTVAGKKHYHIQQEYTAGRLYCNAVKPETLCQFTGETAKWFNEGIDPRIWGGDVLQSEHAFIKNRIHKWKVVYKEAAFFAVRIDDTRDEQLLFKFLSDRVYTKIGNIHESN